MQICDTKGLKLIYGYCIVFCCKRSIWNTQEFRIKREDIYSLYECMYDLWYQIWCICMHSSTCLIRCDIDSTVARQMCWFLLQFLYRLNNLCTLHTTVCSSFWRGSIWDELLLDKRHAHKSMHVCRYLVVPDLFGKATCFSGRLWTTYSSLSYLLPISEM